MIIGKWQMAALAALLTSACHHPGSPDSAAPTMAGAPPVTAMPAATAAPQPAAVDQWLGRWNGPEGTYLAIARSADAYSVEIANLDGPRTYPATSRGEQLEFERDGQTETIHATDGAQTGMKWLQDKTNCLTVKPGEGYCRD